MKQIRQKWKGTMTDRERFNSQMHYRPIDRCFNMEFGYWDENYIEWDIFRDNGITNESQANEFFGFDRIECVGINAWMNPGFEEKVIEDRGATKIIMNADGLTAEIPSDHHDTIYLL